MNENQTDGQEPFRGHHANPAGRTKEWRLIESLLNRSLDEQRRARRWGIFFKCLTFAYLMGIFLMLQPSSLDEGAGADVEHTGLVDVSGVIAADQQANADAIVLGLRRAFKSKRSAAVVLRINSPGGSPVQSDMVYDEIQRLRKQHPDKKLYAAITDVGASGAYYIASAADEIYVADASIVGSIGVISSGFGFVGMLDKLGIERRVYTAGENKGMLDPFLEQSEEELAHFQRLLQDVHAQFIESVRLGRGERLTASNEALFNGRMWTGRQSVELGLVDGIGSPGFVAREVVGAEEIVNYTPKPDPVDALFEKFGVMVQSAGHAILSRTLF